MSDILAKNHILKLFAFFKAMDNTDTCSFMDFVSLYRLAQANKTIFAIFYTELVRRKLLFSIVKPTNGNNFSMYITIKQPEEFCAKTGYFSTEYQQTNVIQVIFLNLHNSIQPPSTQAIIFLKFILHVLKRPEGHALILKQCNILKQTLEKRGLLKSEQENNTITWQICRLTTNEQVLDFPFLAFDGKLLRDISAILSMINDDYPISINIQRMMLAKLLPFENMYYYYTAGFVMSRYDHRNSFFEDIYRDCEQQVLGHKNTILSLFTEVNDAFEAMLIKTIITCPSLNAPEKEILEDIRSRLEIRIDQYIQYLSIHGYSGSSKWEVMRRNSRLTGNIFGFLFLGTIGYYHYQGPSSKPNTINVYIRVENTKPEGPNFAVYEIPFSNKNLDNLLNNLTHFTPEELKSLLKYLPQNFSQEFRKQLTERIQALEQPVAAAPSPSFF
jgi:hypothetical protein